MSVSQQENVQLDAALESTKKAIQIKADFAEAYLNQGNILHQMGKFKEAIYSYNKVLQIKTEHAYACNNISNT